MPEKIIINNEELKQSLLTTMGDKEMVRILNATILQSKSITDIIKETNIPHTTAYRKTKWMVEKGLLTVDRIEVSSDGKKFSLLRSVFKSIESKYEYDKLTVEIEQNVDLLQKIAQKIFSL